MKNTLEYKLVSKHYDNRVAVRSQVPLINHIDEGLIVLDNIGSTDLVKRAFCVHPLFQADEDLLDNTHMVDVLDSRVVLLVMEYRNVANAYLSDKLDSPNSEPIKLSPLSEVNQMLVADKVQNRKDFITYHKDTHPRSDKLDLYFKQWLDALKVTEDQYQLLCNNIKQYFRVK